MCEVFLHGHGEFQSYYRALPIAAWVRVVDSAGKKKKRKGGKGG